MSQCGRTSRSSPDRKLRSACATPPAPPPPSLPMLEEVYPSPSHLFLHTIPSQLSRKMASPSPPPSLSRRMVPLSPSPVQKESRHHEATSQPSRIQKDSLPPPFIASPSPVQKESLHHGIPRSVASQIDMSPYKRSIIAIARESSASTSLQRTGGKEAEREGGKGGGMRGRKEGERGR